MILIADSGSTKTHWCFINKGEVLQEIYTDGINPFYQTEMEIIALLDSQLISRLPENTVEQIFFYGAGCSFPEKKLLVSQALVRFFGNAMIEIQSDLLGAARSLFQHEKGIACILGTGSNSCFYNGNEIVQNISPLGYILGDEGSGAVLGKLLLADYLKNQLPQKINEKLFVQYNFKPAEILDKVYKQPFPNRFLASFVPFLAENIHETAIFNIVYESFDAFLTRNILQYDLTDLKIGFVGSVAYYFSQTLEIVASEHNLLIEQIIKVPMTGLIQYHN